MNIDQSWIHTGQHFTRELFDDITGELEIPAPNFRLQIQASNSAEFVSKCISHLSEIFRKCPNSIAVVYGDVNSSLAAAISAKLEGLHLIHVEAGLRSGEDDLPEEINRKVIDSISDTLCTSMPSAINNLLREGMEVDRIHFCGNTMIDTLLDALAKFNVNERTRNKQEEYALLTLHRGSNVDSADTLMKIIQQVEILAKEVRIIFPAHPRTCRNLNTMKKIEIVPPVSYLNFIKLMKNAKFVITDSGGIQEETTQLNVPCFTLRVATERPETVFWGTNSLINVQDIAGLMKVLSKRKLKEFPNWDGNAGKRVAQVLINQATKLQRL